MFLCITKQQIDGSHPNSMAWLRRAAEGSIAPKWQATQSQLYSLIVELIQNINPAILHV